MPKLVMMPPLDELKRQFAARLAADLPRYQVVAPETVEEARREIGDADAAYGWVPPELLPLAGKLEWLQNPDAGPVPPACDCGTSMLRGELRLPRPRAVSRVGAPAHPPQSLPVWRCSACGCQHPRIES